MPLLSNVCVAEPTDSSQVPGVIGLKWDSREISRSDSPKCLLSVPFMNLNVSLLETLLGRRTILRKRKTPNSELHKIESGALATFLKWPAAGGVNRPLFEKRKIEAHKRSFSWSKGTP